MTAPEPLPATQNIFYKLRQITPDAKANSRQKSSVELFQSLVDTPTIEKANTTER